MYLMNNKNNIRNKTSRLGMIAVVIAAAAMVAIAPTMIANAEALKDRIAASLVDNDSS